MFGSCLPATTPSEISSHCVPELPVGNHMVEKANYTKGDVVVVPFPFADLSGVKKRPVLVLARLIGDDVVICQITGEFRFDEFSISLLGGDLIDGNLQKKSWIRPNKIFTTDSSIVCYKLGQISSDTMKQVERVLVDIFTR